MEQWGNGALGLFLFILFHILKNKGEKKKQERPSPPLPRYRKEEIAPLPLSYAIEDHYPLEEPKSSSPKPVVLKNPLYLPARRISPSRLLRQAKAQKELFILAEIMRRP